MLLETVVRFAIASSLLSHLSEIRLKTSHNGAGAPQLNTSSRLQRKTPNGKDVALSAKLSSYSVFDCDLSL
tara:strand:+ start:543 stop:755 length:213 start_codon:yes stop_codon:yes gene_type:complete